MADSHSRRSQHLISMLRTAFWGPQLLAFLPALILVGFWFGGENALIFCAIAAPIIVALAGLIAPSSAHEKYEGALDAVTHLPMRSALEKHLDDNFHLEPSTGLRSIAIILEIDDFDTYLRDHGAIAGDQILHHCTARLQSALRDSDFLARLDGAQFAVALAPSHRADLETAIQIASRLQSALSDPVKIESLRLFLTACVGFCVPRLASEKTGEFCLEAAETALADARAVGRSAIRAFAAQPRRKRVVQTGLAREVEAALEEGRIVPWFQPQLSTDTGKVSGVEALARWMHPEHGVISPGAFLPIVSAAGLTTRLSDIVLFHTFKAMEAWDLEGLRVPTAGVNFASDDLSDPKLCDRIQWELDRFGLTSDRLTIEILETVISQSSNDMITTNIARLSELGCGIDLDDFGTGHASIANIRRFRVNRIKIDRSFVCNVDTDRQQQQMLSAILEMTNQLEIEALAEGVETASEHTLLAQLGCAHVQGFHVAKPMPVDEATEWLAQHQATMASFPELTKKKRS